MISKIISEELIHKAQNAIDGAEKIAIIVHEGPDGDALGSALGMWHYLMMLQKEPVVIVPNSFPDFYSWMPGADKILVYEQDVAKAEDVLKSSDLIFALDFNVPSRMGKMSTAVVESGKPVVLVDHHLNPGGFAKVCISYPNISSTSELIFRLICRMGDFSKINLACAESLYTGMMSDTGSFSYNSNQHEIYIIVSELIKLGVDKDSIYRKVFNTYSADRLKLMGYCLYKKMKVYPEHQAALISLSAMELQEFNFRNGDSEGFVNIPLSIEGILFSVFLREDAGRIKVSLRSQGTFPANKFAADVYGGGGHLNASGGEFQGTLNDAIRKFEEALPLYKDFL